MKARQKENNYGTDQKIKIFKKSKTQNNEKYQENEYQKLKHSRKEFSKFTSPYVPIDRGRFKDLGKFAHPHKKYHLVET